MNVRDAEVIDKLGSRGGLRQIIFDRELFQFSRTIIKSPRHRDKFLTPSIVLEVTSDLLRDEKTIQVCVAVSLCFGVADSPDTA